MRTDKEIDQELIRINFLYEVFESLAIKFNVSSEAIINSLYILLCDIEYMEWQGDIWDRDISYEKGIHLLKSFDFKILDNVIMIDDVIFPKQCFIEKKVRVKHKGRIWIVHRYDADPFPSNPHAHELSSNVKLNLGNGEYFRNREFQGKIDFKNLLKIREKLLTLYRGALPELSY